MITKIYINDPDVIITPGSTIIDTTTIDRKIIRYTFLFEDNPEFDLSGLPPGLEPADGNYGRIAMDIEKNGSLFVGIDKTFTDVYNDELNTTIGVTPLITAFNLESNLETYNSVSGVTYSVAASDNGYGCRDVYIDIDCLLSDNFTITNFYNNTTNIYFNTVSTTQSTYQVVSTQSTVIDATSTSVDNFKLLDLFDDETIKIVSKLGDIEKLSNVFTDYSNSFTVPATPHNSAIFKHYYDVDVDNTFNANIRVIAYIEIDNFPFRFGTIQLESVQVKNMIPHSYKITFFGGLTQLSDLFEEDTINQLDYDKEIIGGVETLIKNRSVLSQFNYQYNSGNLVNSLNNPSFMGGDIITPLIAYADRDWNYRGGFGDAVEDTIDISTNVGAIIDTELRPAIRIMRLIEGIEAKYGIIFSRNFLGSAVFNNLFMWMNGNVNVTANRIDVALSYYEENDTSLYYENVSIDNDTLSFTDTGYNWESGNFYNLSTYILGPEMKDGSSAIGVNITFELLDGNNNILMSETKTVNDSNNYLSWNYYIDQSNGVPVDYAFKFRFICTDDIKYDGARIFLSNNFGTGPYDNVVVFGESNLMIKPESNLPNMKVSDFLQGIMKQFKLVIRPITSTSYYLDTLNSYYSRGSILDITPFTDQASVEIERPEIYKKVIFKYQKTNNVLGKKFRETYDLISDEVGYGDLKAVYNSIKSKQELKVELPFENMLFERLTHLHTGATLNITIGQSISTTNYRSFTKNNSKPILFFNNGLNNHPDDSIKIKFGDATPGSIIYSYNVGNTNDELLQQVTDTINFNSEIDPWHNQIVANSLYLNYWKNWIDTIYSLRQRKFVYKSYLPTRYIEELSLNDRIIIGNDRYKVNDYEVNLNTGETKLSLFTDIFLWDDYSFLNASNTPYFECDRNVIDSNAAGKYYSVNVITNLDWEVIKFDVGDGTDWVEVLTPSGTGSSEIVFRILEKASQSAPEVYASRTMTFEIVTTSLGSYEVTINQQGLVE